MRILLRFGSVALVAILALSAASAEEPVFEGYARYSSDNSFEDVMDGLRLAIEERGLVINNVMHMDAMLERTGADLGATRTIFVQAQAVEFCSAVLSRAMITEDPTRIVNCPFVIAVYTLPEQPDKTFVAYRRLPAEELNRGDAMRQIAATMAAIAEQAVTW